MSDQLTEEQVRQVARLSRLHLTNEEVRQFTVQLSKVLEYIGKLNELNVEEIEPMAHAMDLTNVLGPDEPKPGLTVDDVLANAPQHTSPFFKVPKVLGDGAGA